MLAHFAAFVYFDNIQKCYLRDTVYLLFTSISFLIGPGINFFYEKAVYIISHKIILHSNKQIIIIKSVSFISFVILNV